MQTFEHLDVPRGARRFSDRHLRGIARALLARYGSDQATVERFLLDVQVIGLDGVSPVPVLADLERLDEFIGELRRLHGVDLAVTAGAA